MSRNYYDPGWSLKTHRRLKNVIVVMDFAPSKAGMQEVASIGKGFTSQQDIRIYGLKDGSTDGYTDARTN